MNKHKHLEMIQGVINRMANNSFLLKGWTITIIAAVFALAAKDSDSRYIIIALCVAPFFWLLDGYYLGQERQYRALYNHVRKLGDDEIDYDMNASGYNEGANTLARSVFSKTLIVFYGPMVVALLAIVIISFCAIA